MKKKKTIKNRYAGDEFETQIKDINSGNYKLK